MLHLHGFRIRGPVPPLASPVSSRSSEMIAGLLMDEGRRPGSRGRRHRAAVRWKTAVVPGTVCNRLVLGPVVKAMGKEWGQDASGRFAARNLSATRVSRDERIHMNQGLE